MKVQLLNAGIIGIGSFVPEYVLTNSELEKTIDTSDEWITSRTGIKQRHIADKDTATSDLAVKAAERALLDAGLTAKEIDLIIVATITPDMIFPSTACIVQSAIGAVNAAAFDINAACSGFVYGLVVANQFISTGLYKNILLIGAEVMSKFVDWNDRNTCVLFGDGAGAVVVGQVEEGYGIKASNLKSDGSGSDSLKVLAGGSRMPTTLETVTDNLHNISMNGNDVFKFAVKVMVSSVEKVLEVAELEIKDVDFLVPHQANIRIIDAAKARLRLPTDKVITNIDKYGNMSAASIPVALEEAIREGKIRKGNNVVIVGFGAGLTWGSCLLKWSK